MRRPTFAKRREFCTGRQPGRRSIRPAARCEALHEPLLTQPSTSLVLRPPYLYSYSSMLSLALALAPHLLSHPSEQKAAVKQHGGVRILGYFKTPEEAALCYARHVKANMQRNTQGQRYASLRTTLTAEQARNLTAYPRLAHVTPLPCPVPLQVALDTLSTKLRVANLPSTFKPDWSRRWRRRGARASYSNAPRTTAAVSWRSNRSLRRSAGGFEPTPPKRRTPLPPARCACPLGQTTPPRVIAPRVIAPRVIAQRAHHSS